MELDTRFASDTLFEPENEKDSKEWDSSSEDEDVSWMSKRSRLSNRHDVPAEYWQMQKMIKYLKGSTPSSTAVVLGCINDFDLESEFMQLALCEANVLELLANILETSPRDFRCKKLALTVLSRASHHVVIQHELTSYGVIPTLVAMLTDEMKDLQRLAASVIANVAKLKKSSKQVRECGGIPVLVHLLDLQEDILRRPKSKLSADEIESLEVTSDAARALWSLSQYDNSKKDMHEAGIILLLPKLLKSRHIEIVIRTMGILQNCGNLPVFQMAIQTLDLVQDIVKLFNSTNMELKVLCALAIFKHSEDERIRELVQKHGGLTPLVRELQQEAIRGNLELLSAVTGAVWKLAISEANVQHFDTINTIPTLVRLLDVDDETVLVHVVGALAECGKLSHNAIVIKRAGGIPPLVELLNRTNQPLLANAAHVLGECAWDLECMREMEEQDAVRLIWSLLKNPSAKVQANAAWALVPCIQNATESGEMVRSFVGGIELIVKRLQSPDPRVVACTCAALAKVADDQENLAVVSDLGVVNILSEACKNTGDNPFLQEHLASAIAHCCNWGKNCFLFGRQGAVAPLVELLYQKNERVQSTTAQALSNLSADPFNCITLHQSGVVPSLIKAAGSADVEKQRAAAKCLTNIRKLALRADKERFEQRVRKACKTAKPESPTATVVGNERRNTGTTLSMRFPTT